MAVLYSCSDCVNLVHIYSTTHSTHKIGSSFPVIKRAFQSLTPFYKDKAVFITCSNQTNVAVNPLNAELNPICYLLALLGAHHFLHISRIRVKSLTLRLLMSYIYIYIYMEHLFLMFLDHTQLRTTVGRTPLDE